MIIDQRATLERLIQDTGADYAGLSRLLGRNPAYIQQFIKRGVPRKLDEKDRQLLARFFGIDESVLGGPTSARLVSDELIPIKRLDVGASAGFGADAEEDVQLAPMAFDRRWLRQLSPNGTAGLSMIRVRGDSMTPTLLDGDEILVDRSDKADALRDGIYVLRSDNALMVKRIALSPSARVVSIKSDNLSYPSWPDCDVSAIDVIGRVVWAGRRLS